MSTVFSSGMPVSVSVIVPCFNRAETVAEAIQSVLDQSWHDLEVIAVDDGSSDDSWAVMKRIAATMGPPTVQPLGLRSRTVTICGYLTSWIGR